MNYSVLYKLPAAVQVQFTIYNDCFHWINKDRTDGGGVWNSTALSLSVLANGGRCFRACFAASLRRAERTGVVLAGLQPDSDAVFVDGVGAVQRVPALRIHAVLTHQAGFMSSDGLTSTH